MAELPFKLQLSKAPKVIRLDIILLPDMTGIEVTRQLRQILPSRHAQVDRQQMLFADRMLRKRYMGCLTFDDPAFCRSIFSTLKAYRVRSIKDVGDVDLTGGD